MYKGDKRMALAHCFHILRHFHGGVLRAHPRTLVPLIGMADGWRACAKNQTRMCSWRNARVGGMRQEDIRFAKMTHCEKVAHALVMSNILGLAFPTLRSASSMRSSSHGSCHPAALRVML